MKLTMIILNMKFYVIGVFIKYLYLHFFITNDIQIYLNDLSTLK